ncbi:EEIG1/EHBP1 PROTEIN AMINO-TERMINAL DOMAIN PROTEIN [Salix purpurea]|uniref:EEIG1/EHBP1 PROTEIN AMINO-TERMINAL DOMAIN PROTEIN n=1 Tax=Salix purpurea TaxID=77065 RepID=A0A9Q0VTB8_SALPP|nr:EEIG1/EHBP1 PROTEIN AMINO-TERMINAL DOMAIN PROTEIN [Salix purpurea]
MGTSKKQFSEDEPIDNFPYDARDDDSLGSDTFTSPGGIDMKGNILKIDRLKHVKSVRSSSDSLRSNGFGSRVYNEVGLMRDAHHSAGSLSLNERKNAKIHPKDTRTTILDGKIQKLEHKIKMLEGELKEAAAIEAALYSVISEHGSSMSKVHAPARRLSRLYLHACRESFQSRRASAARSAISGLVLVAKACGNDVPRLTFWLSNSVVLRTIISQTIEVSPSRKGNNVLYEDSSDWEDPHAFTSALERVEAWIFSRIIESIWWQTLTPHMQVAATKEIARLDSSGSKKKLGKTSRLVHEDQGSISLEHWKKAFKDACERLCPVRAGGHECGCLPVLARLIMEQCVARLDVAMFNAILRESVDEIPSDPVSDPISDPIVLPIPAGTSSFAVGAQLKNVIGNWSRWLTDLFGMDADDLLEDDNENNEIDERPDTTFKSFHLLNALSDLMMLPKDMLLSKSIRKERVLDNFVSDEFCPDPIPDVVFEALDVEDAIEAGEESVTTVPCIAAPPIYLPPSAASIAKIIGEFGSQSKLRKSGSSIVRKSYTSDDELDELNSPLASIVLDGVRSSPAPTKASWKSRKGIDNTIRYELLREIWMNSE